MMDYLRHRLAQWVGAAAAAAMADDVRKTHSVLPKHALPPVTIGADGELLADGVRTSLLDEAFHRDRALAHTALAEHIGAREKHEADVATMSSMLTRSGLVGNEPEDFARLLIENGATFPEDVR